MRRPPTRRFCSARALVVAAAIACAVSTAARAADTYPIKFDRPVKVGQEFTVAVKGDSNQTVVVTMNGQAQPTPAQKFSAELTGVMKVLAVNAATGNPTKVQVTVAKLTRDGADVLPAGAVFVADHAGEKTTFTIDGTDVEAEQAAVLDLMVDVEKADKTLDEDAMFGTSTPQPVGGQWDADTAKMVADMGDQLPISPEHLKASTKLVKVDQVDGKPVETLETTFAADPLDVGKQVNGMTVTGGSMSGTVTQTMSVDPSRPATSQDLHMTMKMTGTAAGGAAKADVSAERTVHRTMTPKG